MFAVVINEKGGQPRRQEFAKSEVTIGRVQGNDIILPKQNVSKRHSRIVVKDGKFIIVDLKSTNGTYVNGRKIASPMVIKGSDKIYIGDFILSVDGLEGALAEAAPAAQPAAPPPQPAMPAPVAEPPRPKPGPPPPPRPKPAAAPPAPAPAPAPRPVPAAPAPAPQPMAAPRPVPTPPSPPAPPPPPAHPAPAPAPAPIAPAPMAAPTPAPAPIPAPAMPAPPARPAPVPMPMPMAMPAAAAPAPLAAPPAMGDDYGPAMLELHERLADTIDAQNIRIPTAFAPGYGVDEIAWQRAEQAVRNAAAELRSQGHLPPDADLDAIASTVVSEALALGPITALVADASVSRVMVNGAGQIFLTRGDRTEPYGARFSGNGQVVTVAWRLLAAAGVAPVPGSGFAEGHLADGWRVHAALPAVGGPFLTLDRGAAAARGLDELVAADVLSAQMGAFLELALRVGRTVVIASNDVDARCELIGAILEGGAAGQRVVTVEGGARLAGRGHVVALSGATGADNTVLVQQALKMRPDRLVVADCRGPETFYAISALSGAVNGGVLGVTASTTEDALVRLVRQAALAVSADDERVEAIVVDALDVIVEVLRYADGQCRVSTIVDIDGGEMQEVFNGAAGYRATGHVPRFVNDAQNLGHDVDLNIFR